MKKHIMLGVVIAVAVAGVGIIIGSQSVRFGGDFGSARGINSRVMAVVALPFVFLLYLLRGYLRKKIEDRKWKNAILESHANKQKSKQD